MAKSQPIYSAKGEQELMLHVWSPEIRDDPEKFVMFMYPWGQKGTPLEHQTGPRKWQREILREIRDYIRDGRNTLMSQNVLSPMFKAAVASGRGIGKSACFSWIAHWLVSTRLGSSVWVTANGEPQLKTKTFPEIGKWVAMAINAHWFDVQATSIKPAQWFADAVQKDLKIDPGYWYIQAQLWSEENPDAFAGAHNHYGECYLFDEASGIPSPIWTVAAGVFTEPIIDRYWLAFSNPRRNTGAFYECFHGEARNQWRRKNIDARTVEGNAQDELLAIIAKHGANSDEARMEVYGEFPNQSANQFIANDIVDDAMSRTVDVDIGAPLLMGVDVARYGNDRSVIAFRQGRDARSIPWQFYQHLPVDQLANRVAEAAQKFKPDAIFVDGGGVGGGVVDLLKSWGFKVIEVQFGAKPKDGDKYANKRTEMWDLMREWLHTAAVPHDRDLRTDLISPEYSYHATSNKMGLESKEDMKKRGIASPDGADALAMTFAQTVARNDTRLSRNNPSRRNAVARDIDYSLFG